MQKILLLQYWMMLVVDIETSIYSVSQMVNMRTDIAKLFADGSTAVLLDTVMEDLEKAVENREEVVLVITKDGELFMALTPSEMHW